MGAPYTIPIMNNITSPIVATNDLTGGFGGLMLSMSIFIIIAITISGTKGANIIDGLTFASIISVVVNVLLLPLGLTSSTTLGIFLSIMLGTIFISFFTKK